MTAYVIADTESVNSVLVERYRPSLDRLSQAEAHPQFLARTCFF